MAIAIGTADEKLLRLEFQDAKGKRVTKTYALSGTVSDADIITALGYIDNMSNAFVVRGVILTSRPITGMKAAAVNALQNTNVSEMLLTFSKVNPINAAKTVLKEVVIPSYVDALEQSDGTPDQTNNDLLGWIVFCQTNLTYFAANGTFYPGNWTYQDAQSGFFGAAGQQ